MSSKVKKVEPAPIEKLNAWKVAQQQLRNVAELIQLDEDIFSILSTPRVCMTVSVPIRHDDGRIRVYIGHRVQHSVARGPGKGGIPGRRAPVTFVAIEPIDGYRPMVLAPVAPGRPVSIRWAPPKWSPSLCQIDRTMENLSATLACFGKSSLISMPATFVRMGRHIPRYSAGALGFMS